MAQGVFILSLFNTHAILLLVVILFTILWFNRRRRNLPPGPKGLPFFGCLFSLGKKPYETFFEWRHVYGDVMTLPLGTELVIMLNSREVIKDAFVKQASSFSNRPRNYPFAKVFKNHGVLDADSPAWQVLRKFAIKSLGEFGMGKATNEERILNECDFLIEQLEKHLDTPFDVHSLISNAISNIMCFMLFGHRFDYDDKHFARLLRHDETFLQTIMSSDILTFIPVLWYFPLPIKRKLNEDWRTLRDFLVEKYEERKLKIQDQDGGACIIDKFILKEKEYQQKPPEDPTLSCIVDPEHLYATLYELFSGGTVSTVQVLRWGLFYLAKNPSVQNRCVSEIANGIGMRKIPSITDKPNLPFIEATYLEIQRLSSVLPIPVPHATSEAVTFRGFSIPKAAMVLINVWAVHMDETDWNTPKAFDPERFLDENGKVSNVQRSKIMPFSIGPRECLGMEMAKVQIFLILISLLQRFEFKLPEGDNTDEEGYFAQYRMPYPHQLIIKTREYSGVP